MVKNSLFWLTFSLLLALISASVCLAGQNGEAANLQQSVYCAKSMDKKPSHPIPSKEEGQIEKKDNKDEIKNSPASILNTNVIFYIFYRFKFVGTAQSMELNDDGEKPAIPIINYSRNIFNYFYNLFGRLK